MTTLGLPDIADLHRLLRYDPETGVLYWRERPLDLCKSESARRTFNTRRAGAAVGATDADGYLIMKVRQKLLKAHRVVWAMHYGAWPQGEIDHINHAKQDNRITNLRTVSRAANARNQPPHKCNKSGVVGVNFRPSKGWRAFITAEGRRIHLGYFKERAEAVEARSAAERRFGFHPNHGRAA